MYNQTDKALHVLLKDKKRFVAFYSPIKATSSVDFSTGEREILNKITFSSGAFLTREEVRSFSKDMPITSTKNTYLIVENTATVDITAKVVVDSATYTIKEANNSFYSKWQLLVLTRTVGIDVQSAEVKDLYASDRTKAYTDWLVNAVKIKLGPIPPDLVLWPLVGFNVAESLKYIWPANRSVIASGDLSFKEVGRTSGYTGTGLIDGQAPKKATSYAQTNYDVLSDIVDQYNTYMGRL